MKNSIYNNKLKNSLKYAKEMLNTLRTNELNLQNYYHLYTSIFDEMQHMLNYFQEELHRGRIIQDFYDIIQKWNKRRFLKIIKISLWLAQYKKGAYLCR